MHRTPWSSRVSTVRSRSSPMAWGQMYLDCWNRGSPLALFTVFAPDCRYEDVGTGSILYGHPGIRRRLELIKTSWPDAHFSYVSSFTNFDRYTVEWVMTGTSGRDPFVTSGVSVGLLDGYGRIAHNRDYHDGPYTLPDLEALGNPLKPPVDTAPA